jgi:general secretion pathway protein F
MESSAFLVRYIDSEQRVRTERLYAADSQDARSQLLARDIRVLKVSRERTANRALPEALGLNINIEVVRAFLALLRPGLAIHLAVTICLKEASALKVRRALSSVAGSLDSGASFSGALRNSKGFDPLLVASIAAAEPSGKITEALERWLEQAEHAQRLHSTIRAALTYPAIVVLVALCVMAFLLLFLLPKFSTVFEDSRAALPWMSVALFSVSKTIREQWLPCLSLVLLLVSVLTWLRRMGKISQIVRSSFIVLPVVRRLMAEWELARFYRVLAMLLFSGIPVVRAISIVNAAAPDTRLETLVEELSSGESIVLALEHSGLTTDSSKYLLALAEASGGLDQTCLQVADLYDERFSNRVASAMRIAEPVLMLGLSLFVGAMVLAMYLPIFDLASNVR